MKIQELFKWHIALFCLVANIGCHGMSLDDKTEHFLSKSIQEQRSDLLNYPFDQQVDLYLAAMLEQHPPDLKLADVVASNGVGIIPYLKERIRKDTRVIADIYLISIFVSMERFGYYPVRENRDLMRFLYDDVNSIRDAQWREVGIGMLEEIRKIKERK